MHMVFNYICNLRKVIIYFLYSTLLVSLVYLRFGTFEESWLAFKHVCPLATCAHRMGDNLKQIDV